MSDTNEFPQLPPHLRLLQTLVTVLMVVMILGVIGVVATLVTRMPTQVTVPEALNLPEGAVVQAVTQGKGWWAVVTEDARILIFNGAGELAQEVNVTLE